MNVFGIDTARKKSGRDEKLARPLAVVVSVRVCCGEHNNALVDRQVGFGVFPDTNATAMWQKGFYAASDMKRTVHPLRIITSTLNFREQPVVDGPQRWSKDRLIHPSGDRNIRVEVLSVDAHWYVFGSQAGDRFYRLVLLLLQEDIAFSLRTTNPVLPFR